MSDNTIREVYSPGTDITAEATATVTGSRFVAVAAAGLTRDVCLSVQHAEPGDYPVGVAKHDASTGGLLGVARGAGRVLYVAAEAGLTPGDPVEVGDNGIAAAADTGPVIGVAVTATTDGRAAINLF